MVQTGLERILAGEQMPALHGKRIGLLANHTAVDSHFRHAIDLFASDPHIDLRVLFGPEHGLRGDAQDMIAVASDRDRRTGLPVVSLYGSDEVSLSPRQEHLADLDAVVYDIQDVGARYYTFLWTMVLAMRACARAGVGFVVLDRPNPVAGEAIEGGPIAPGYQSFVGLCSVPNRHGMTAAEMARWVCARESLDVDLTVVAMAGWKRSMYYEDTGLAWVMPSPNMPTRDTALVYPGMCLVEGTELSEGRGTTRPFELAGAPFVDSEVLAGLLEKEELPGVRFRPHTFTPMFQKHAGRQCGGVQIHVTEPRRFRPYRTGVAFLRAVNQRWPEAFAWRERAYEFVADVPAIDLLAGSPSLRGGIESGATVDELAAAWTEFEAEFAAERAAYLLYQ
ncbi:MAG: DUF1343 domain-containing protein [Proteobacteria bacterium]|nr:DUF1343 domain-containing protein [Pseudomonadota bacterium]